MPNQHNSYELIPFPKMRRVVIDIGWMARQKHTIRGLVEIDVTTSRQFIQEHKTRTGEILSFTAFLVACVGRAVDMDKSVHAYRNWRGQLVLFNEVDITTMIEVETGGQKLLTGHIIRAANKKTFQMIFLL